MLRIKLLGGLHVLAPSELVLLAKGSGEPPREQHHAVYARLHAVRGILLLSVQQLFSKQGDASFLGWFFDLLLPVQIRISHVEQSALLCGSASTWNLWAVPFLLLLFLLFFLALKELLELLKQAFLSFLILHAVLYRAAQAHLNLVHLQLIRIVLVLLRLLLLRLQLRILNDWEHFLCVYWGRDQRRRFFFLGGWLLLLLGEQDRLVPKRVFVLVSLQGDLDSFIYGWERDL